MPGRFGFTMSQEQSHWRISIITQPATNGVVEPTFRAPSSTSGPGELLTTADPGSPFVALSQDAERLAPFEREAKLLARLNHPSIAAIHSVG